MSPLPRPALREGARTALQREVGWIAALLAALAALLALTQASWRWDRVVYDQALAWSARPVPAGITVIAIDDASLAAIGRWPWSRAVHATLLEQLVPLQPRAVLLDLVLSEPDADPRQDALLAAALQRLQRAVLPVPWVSVNGAEPQWLLPTPVLAAAARLGAAESVPDADGVLRHAFLQVGPASAPRPHVALQMLQAAGEATGSGARDAATAPAAAAEVAAPGAWRRDGRFAIRYAGPAGHVDSVSYVDVLRGVVPAARLQGRHVLVGMTAQGLGDRYATPVGTQHGTMPGVEVLAQTLHMLRQGDRLHLPSPATVAAGSAALVFGGVLLLARLGQRRALWGAGLAVAGLLLASALGVAAGFWWPPLPAAAALLLAYPLWSWRRLEHAVAGLDAQILQLHGGPATAAARALAPAPGADAIDARLQRLHAAGTLLHQARRYLADVLEGLPSAMLVADAEHRVLMANARAAALFEVEDAAELQGLDLPRLLQEFSGADAPDWTQALSQAVPGVAAPAWELHLPGQGDFVLRLSAAELAGSRRLLLSITDVEPVKRAQRQREEALAFVSHDLRSPVSAILLLTDPATAPGGAPAAGLPQVRQLAQRALDLSDAFVRYAQADLLAPQRAPVAVQSLVDDALAELWPRAQALGLRLGSQVPPAGVVVLDRHLVARALANLVSNALRHSPPAGQVQLRCRLDEDGVCFEVVDQGPGLSAAQQGQLHDAEEGLRSGDARGLGLGLRFVQRVARRHGGQLRWRPAAGAEGPTGSCFELRLPAPESGNP